jgi:hypothetical protein
VQVPALQVSVWVHAMPSLQAAVVKVTAQVGVPLHDRVLQVSLVHVIGVPVQVPALQVSVWVHAMPSLQAAVVKVTAQVGVPLHDRALQVSLVHVSAVPAQTPLPLQRSV